MAGEVIATLIERNRESLLKRLPSYLSPEQFFQLCHALDRNKKLAALAQRKPDELLAAVFKAADCGLTIGDAFGHCWITAFGEEIVFMVGWRGMVYQWKRAGAVLKVTAMPVYTGDDIEVVAGDDEAIHHKPALFDPHRDDPKWMNDKANILGSYAVAWLPEHPLKAYRWCSRGQIEAARLRSSNKDGPAWTHNYPQMAAKTAVRRLDGIIQACGPTPENKEAWDRYSRTVQMEHDQYHNSDEDNEDPDLPGATTGSASPPTGAAVEHSSGRGPSPRGGRKRLESAAPPPPQNPEILEPTLTDEQQDKLIAEAGLCGMPASKLKRYVSEKYKVGDINDLTPTQAKQLSLELKAQSTK